VPNSTMVHLRTLIIAVMPLMSACFVVCSQMWSHKISIHQCRVAYATISRGMCRALEERRNTIDNTGCGKTLIAARVIENLPPRTSHQKNGCCLSGAQTRPLVWPNKRRVRRSSPIVEKLVGKKQASWPDEIRSSPMLGGKVTSFLGAAALFQALRTTDQVLEMLTDFPYSCFWRVSQ
jgi:hypothetical protein